MAGQRHRSLKDRLLFNSVAVQYPGVKGECWVWIGKLNSKGYGHITMRTKRTPNDIALGRPAQPRNMMAHRVAYEEFTGNTLGEGVTVDHTCECPACINPDHHKAVTRKRNSELRWERKR